MMLKKSRKPIIYPQIDADFFIRRLRRLTQIFIVGAASGANVAPSGRRSRLLSYPGLRRPPGASPGVMHGAALRAEFGLSLSG